MSSPPPSTIINDSANDETTTINRENTIFLTPQKSTEFTPIQLIQKTIISPDTRVFRFALEHPNQSLGLPIGQHMSLRATIDNGVVLRSYTPVSTNADLGYVDFVIKVYFSGADPKFPNGGKMSQHLEQLKIGDTIDVKGPTGRFDYQGRGAFKLKTGVNVFKTQTGVKKMAMIAGGSGITPMLQIIHAVLKDPEDKTEIFLLFGNKTTKDILLKDELDTIAAKHPDRFHVWYTITRPQEEEEDFKSKWKFSTGHIDGEMIKKHLPSGSASNGDDDNNNNNNNGNKESVIAFLCGPSGMINQACKPNLLLHGYQADQMVVF